jgi:hypothetical protein
LTASEIARQLGSAFRCGSWWRCRCPVHQSRGATLALKDGDRALVVVCHGGCSRAEIIAELGRLGLFDGTFKPDLLGSTAAPNGEFTRKQARALRLWEKA